MSIIEITVPVESLEAIWQDDCAQLLALTEHGVDIEREDLHIPPVPRIKGEVVESEPVVFTFHDLATVNGFRAYLKNGDILTGTTPRIRVRPGDRIACVLMIKGG